MNRPTKIVVSIAAIRVAVIVAIIGFIGYIGYILFQFRPFSTNEVRRRWSETALAHSEYYHITEDENRVKNDAIYFTIKEIPGKTFEYRCIRSPRICTLGEDDLNFYYFSRKYANKLQYLMEKHQLTSATHALKYQQISDVWGFAQDLLEIPDLRRLYQAFVAECRRTNVEQAESAFGWYFLIDVTRGDDDYFPKLNYLFSWMMEQGM